MKKIAIIGAAIGLAFASSAFAAKVVDTATTSVDVYGFAKGAHKFEAHGKTNGKDASELQVGVKAKQQLNPYFAGIAQYEGQYNVYPQRYVTRQAWAGVDAGDFGAVTVGRQTGLVYDVTGMSDVAPGVLSGNTANADSGLLGRADSVIQYKNSFNGVTVKGQYKLATKGKSLEGNVNDEGVSYGASATVANIGDSGVGAGVAYATTETLKNAQAGVYAVGLNYTNGGFYTAATNAQGKTSNGKALRDTEVVAQYNFDNGLTPSIGYVDVAQEGKADIKAVETGVNYAFNKNVSAYVDAGWDTTGRHDNQVKTAVKYSF